MVSGTITCNDIQVYQNLNCSKKVQCEDVVATGEVQSDSVITGTASANDLTVFGVSDLNTVTATKYQINTGSNTSTDLFKYEALTPDTIVCAIPEFRADTLNIAQIKADGGTLEFRDASQIDFGNINVINWNGPSGGGGGGGDQFPVNVQGTGYVVDLNLVLASGRDVMCDAV